MRQKRYKPYGRLQKPIHLKKNNADYTQAMMDLGALICTRKNPLCDRCPFSKSCIAYQQQLVDDLPRKKTPRQMPIKQSIFIICKQQNKILLQKRPSKGIWGGLWAFPELLSLAIAKQANPKKSILNFCQTQLNMIGTHYKKLTPFRHTFTHYHLDIQPIVVEITELVLTGKAVADHAQIWYKLNEVIPVGIPKPVQTIITTLRGGMQ